MSENWPGQEGRLMVQALDRVQVYYRLSTESLTNSIHVPQLSHLNFVFIYLTTSLQILFIRLRNLRFFLYVSFLKMAYL